MSTPNTPNNNNLDLDGEPLQTGSRVMYKGKVYFIKLNGSSCYLYDTLKDQENNTSAVSSPTKAVVMRNTQAERERRARAASSSSPSRHPASPQVDDGDDNDDGTPALPAGQAPAQTPPGGRYENDFDVDVDLDGKPLGRHSRVFYKGAEYYFQPNGCNACYLYANASDVGELSRKVYAPSPNTVRKHTQRERVRRGLLAPASLIERFDATVQRTPPSQSRQPIHVPRTRVDADGRPLQRGSRVVYNGEVFYFQPNGSSCYLYRHKEDVGRRFASDFSPAVSSVLKHTREARSSGSGIASPRNLLSRFNSVAAPSSRDSNDDGDRPAQPAAPAPSRPSPDMCAVCTMYPRLPRRAYCRRCFNDYQRARRSDRNVSIDSRTAKGRGFRDLLAQSRVEERDSELRRELQRSRNAAPTPRTRVKIVPVTRPSVIYPSGDLLVGTARSDVPSEVSHLSFDEDEESYVEGSPTGSVLVRERYRFDDSFASSSGYDSEDDDASGGGDADEDGDGVRDTPTSPDRTTTPPATPPATTAATTDDKDAFAKEEDLVVSMLHYHTRLHEILAHVDKLDVLADDFARHVAGLELAVAVAAFEGIVRELPFLVTLEAIRSSDGDEASFHNLVNNWPGGEARFRELCGVGSNETFANYSTLLERAYASVAERHLSTNHLSGDFLGFAHACHKAMGFGADKATAFNELADLFSVYQAQWECVCFCYCVRHCTCHGTTHQTVRRKKGQVTCFLASVADASAEFEVLLSSRDMVAEFDGLTKLMRSSITLTGHEELWRHGMSVEMARTLIKCLLDVTVNMTHFCVELFGDSLAHLDFSNGCAAGCCDDYEGGLFCGGGPAALAGEESETDDSESEGSSLARDKGKGASE